VVFPRHDDEIRIDTFYRNGKIFDNPAKLIEVKQLFYCVRILNTLFPDNFPVWHFAGQNNGGHVGSVREFAAGAVNRERESSEIRQIVRLLAANNIRISLDLAAVNIFYSDIEKYVDSPGRVFVESSEDIEKIVKFAKGIKIDQEKINRIIRFGKRVLELEKQK
jgi:hypothetical protein